MPSFTTLNAIDVRSDDLESQPELYHSANQVWDMPPAHYERLQWQLVDMEKRIMEKLEELKLIRVESEFKVQIAPPPWTLSPVKVAKVPKKKPGKAKRRTKHA